MRELVRTRVKGMVSDTSFMACRHSRVETVFFLECLLDCVNMALHVHLGGE